MLILTIRTDKPEAELGLYEDQKQLDYVTWPAHRALAETIHTKMRELLQKHNYDWLQLQGVAVFKGPGSFTGLRIGISVANAMADGLQIPLIGAEGANWLDYGLAALQADKNDKVVVPEYGAAPHTTPPRH